MADRNTHELYTIEYRADGVYLSVVKPQSLGLRVSDNEILEEIRRKHIKAYNASLVSEITKKADGVPAKFADAQTEEAVDATCEAFASPDKMQAFLILYANEGAGKPITYERIVEALSIKGILFGINEKRIRELAEYPTYNSNILIAEGIPGKNGKNGEVKMLVDVRRDRKPVISEDGSVNFKELDMIENVNKGQRLAELIAPIPGQLGKNVVGTELKPLDGKPAVFPKGRNVTISDDGKTLFADIDGQVMFVDGKLSVFSTYEVHADVDNSTGNINFVGNVVIRGNVLSGFVVEAGGNIEVQGVVEGATLKAGGDIILKRGMVGNSKGIITANGDIIAKYIESCTVEARGDVRSEAIMHSDVKCGNRLELGGKKGLLVGGIARVGKEVEAKVIGSQMSTATVVEVGVDPHLRERLKFLRSEIIQMEESLKKSNQAIALLKRFDREGLLTDDKRDMLAKSTRAKFFYESKLMDYKKESIEIDEKLQVVANGRIKVLLTCYNGTRVSIGSCTMYVKEELSRCTLYRDGADVRVGAL